MRVGVPKESAEGERRVALVPDIIKKLTNAGHEVVIEAGAGDQARIPDELLVDAGATTGDPWATDVVVKVAAPSAEETSSSAPTGC